MTRVLVVEDSATQAEELRLILESEGFEVDAAADGRQGLTKIQQQQFDLVISDIVMPEMTGYELCAAIKKNPGIRDLPVLLLTTLSDPMDIIRGLECGADNFITKPYDIALLVSRIRNMLENRKLRSAGKLRVGVEIMFLGRHFLINSDREQILDLLISAFEETVRTNRDLRSKDVELASANARIEEYVRQLEERVRTSEEHFRSLVETMDDAVYTLDTRLRFTGVFGGWLAKRVTDPAVFVGKSAGDVFGVETAPAHEAAGARALGGERVMYEWTQDGTEGVSHFHTSLVPLRGKDGAVTGLVGVSREVTDQRRLQAQLMVSDRMASVGMLAAGVAHEINNPLASVMANLDLAARDVDLRAGLDKGFEELSEELTDAMEGAERVRRIVQDLKVFSRAEDPDKLGPVDVERTLESSLRMASNEIRHRARLVRDFSSVPPVLANESRLGQVFLNLLINSSQAIPVGHADTNKIRVSTSLDPAGRVVIELGDTGPGIPPEIQRHIFSPFFTTKPAGVGTGLGLAICHRLVTGFGGTIRVETGPGKGTVFTITLLPAPAALVQADVAAVTPVGVAAATPVKDGPVRRGRILVIDDEPMITVAVRRVLAVEHEVVTVNSAKQALELLGRSEAFDVILCDLMMPEMSGMELHAALERNEPESAARMLFLTGGAFTPVARAFLDRNAPQRIEKPFDNKQLRAMVNARMV